MLMTLPWALPLPTISSCYKYHLFVTTSFSSRVLRPSLSPHCFFSFGEPSMASLLLVSSTISSLVDLTYFPIWLDHVADHPCYSTHCPTMPSWRTPSAAPTTGDPNHLILLDLSLTSSTSHLLNNVSKPSALSTPNPSPQEDQLPSCLPEKIRASGRNNFNFLANSPSPFLVSKKVSLLL